MVLVGKEVDMMTDAQSTIADKKISPFDVSIEDEMIALFHPPAVGGEDDTSASSVSSMLNGVEERFLNAGFVTEPGSTEADLVRQFSKTTMDQKPSDTREYMQDMVGKVVKDSVHCCAPTMIGHMTTSLPFYMRPLSKLVTTIHANNVKIETGKAQTFMEREVLAMLHRHIFHQDDAFYDRQSHNPSVALGVVCSGGTIANNSALWIARNRCMPPNGDFLGIDKQGLMRGLRHYKYDDAVIIGSKVMHYSMKKAADVLGIGTDGLLTCPFTEQYQVDIAAMKQHILDCEANNIAILALVGVAGGTETGSIDDLNAIADLAQKHNIHFHVDAAWGGPVIFSSHKEKMAGIERADTVTLDGHKQLYTPMGCGLCFLRDPAHIHAVEKTANYIIRKESYDLGKFSMEGSRPAVSMFLHANLAIMGVSGLGALVDRGIRLVSFMAKALKDTGEFEQVLIPQTNILLYRWLPTALRGVATLTRDQTAQVDAVNIELQSKQRASGLAFVSRTNIFSPKQQAHVVALRAVIANPLTNERDIMFTLNDQMRIAAGLPCV